MIFKFIVITYTTFLTIDYVLYAIFIHAAPIDFDYLTADPDFFQLFKYNAHIVTCTPKPTQHEWKM